MKHMMFAVCCGVLALTGCRYGEKATDADLTDSTVAIGNGETDTIGSDIETVTVDDPNGFDAENGSLQPATAIPFDQLYARVTDVEFAPVYFGFDANTLQSGELSKIEQVAAHLAQNTDQVVVIEGNCDDRGSNEYNLVLGEQRAISIRDYLVTLGLAADRVQTKSYGEEKPAVAGSGEEVWAKNRRGEFALYRK